MTTTTPALIGRFAADCRTFLARPVRMHGQPSRTLRHLATIYTRHPANAPTVTNLLMARDWAEINVATQPRPRDPRHEVMSGFGLCYRLGVDMGPVAGHILEDQPWRPGEWAYLWEYGHGALHLYLSARARWHHLATISPDLLHRMDSRQAADIQARAAWLELAR